VNLSNEALTSDGVLLPPKSLLIAEHYYRGAFCSVKTGRRFRLVPLPETVVDVLRRMRPEDATPEMLVFRNRRGGLVSDLNLLKRQLQPAGEKIGLPFRLSWHVFRRSTATLLEAIGMPLSERQTILGHSLPHMTLYYTIADLERRRELLEKLAERIVPGEQAFCAGAR